MGDNSFAPFSTNPVCFVVQNVASIKKTIMIFNYPINHGDSRDLLRIPGVAEDDIRASLLKGELNHKIRANEIVVTCSDIDLLQFNDTNKFFLEAAGISKGLQVTSDQMSVIRKEDIQLIGLVNDVNTIFTIPDGSFIQDSMYKIIAYKNGVKQFFLDDYFIAESGGPGTGYNTVIFTEAPEASVLPIDVITADYYINNSGF